MRKNVLAAFAVCALVLMGGCGQDAGGSPSDGNGLIDFVTSDTTPTETPTTPDAVDDDGGEPQAQEAPQAAPKSDDGPRQDPREQFDFAYVNDRTTFDERIVLESTKIGVDVSADGTMHVVLGFKGHNMTGVDAGIDKLPRIFVNGQELVGTIYGDTMLDLNEGRGKYEGNIAAADEIVVRVGSSESRCAVGFVDSTCDLDGIRNGSQDALMGAPEIAASDDASLAKALSERIATLAAGCGIVNGQVRSSCSVSDTRMFKSPTEEMTWHVKGKVTNVGSSDEPCIVSITLLSETGEALRTQVVRMESVKAGKMQSFDVKFYPVNRVPADFTVSVSANLL